MIDRTRQTPVIILTGFLGAGKSTLLRQLLEGPGAEGTGLIINEFGDVAVDHELVAAGLRDVAVTSTGCICCTAGSDIRASVAEVHEAARATGRLPLNCVVVETTGLADPAPVVNQLVAGAVPALGLRDHTVARHYRLAGVVAVFDAVEGPDTLKHHPEAVKQLAFADRILITKTDLLPEVARAERHDTLRTLIERINRTATIEDVQGPSFTLSDAFRPRPYAPADLGDDVEAWLGEADGDNHDHHHHGHDMAAGSGIRTVSLTLDQPITQDALARTMDLIGVFLGPRLLRLKGIIAFADAPETPHVLQVVQHVVHPLALLEAWPGDDHRTRIVAITSGVDPGEIEKIFANLKSAPVREPAV
ncbi:GTP-binding protein [Acuticoccus sp. MNP-M23]|uniref:CobW family GTP-binding protein n=1 Tax=Acuticoccus sp. MNP-M23 TaxID=3072793 RepID=UPI0028164CB1|nr:GTP-binding protein [Acuticoccus sp. MNP-M23]WMS43954.1 GTP-binding protein [Acuticoccus sp. MNP-M23]